MSELHKDKQVVVLVVVVSLALMLAAFVTAIALTGHINARSTPIISAFLGLLAILVPAIAATLRSSQTRELTREVDRKVNGHLSRLTEAAINAGVKPEDLPPLPADIEKPKES